MVYGQDYNKRAFATAASDMLMKQVDCDAEAERTWKALAVANIGAGP